MGINYFNPKDLIKKDTTVKSEVLPFSDVKKVNVDEVYKLASERKINVRPIDIEKVITDIFRIIVQKEDLGKMSGYLESRPSGWYIIVNEYENVKRQRFTLAHELAHYILHSELIEGRHDDIILFRNESYNKMEKEANDFASDLLIPTDWFLEEVQRGNRVITDLSETFNVSIAAIKYKAFKLNLIKEYR